MAAQQCPGFQASGLVREPAAVYGGLSRPVLAAASVGFVPLMTRRGYAAAAMAYWLERGEYVVRLVYGEEEALSRLDPAAVSEGEAVKAARLLARAARCLAGVLEEYAGVRVTENPWGPLEPVASETVLVVERGGVKRLEGGRGLAAVLALWLKRAAEEAAYCSSRPCPLLAWMDASPALTARLEEKCLAEASAYSASPIPVYSFEPADARETVAVPGLGVASGDYLREAARAGARAILPSPPRRIASLTGRLTAVAPGL